MHADWLYFFLKKVILSTQNLNCVFLCVEYALKQSLSVQKNLSLNQPFYTLATLSYKRTQNFVQLIIKR